MINQSGILYFIFFGNFVVEDFLEFGKEFIRVFCRMEDIDIELVLV